MIQCTNCGLHLTAQQVETGSCPNCKTSIADIQAREHAQQQRVTAQSPIQTMDPSQHSFPIESDPPPSTMKTSAADISPAVGNTISAAEDTNPDGIQTVDIVNTPPPPPNQTLMAHGSKAARGTDAAKQMWNALADSASSPMMTVKTEEMSRGREQQLVIHRRTLTPDEEPESDDADYRLTRFLGEGGMGSVYVAQQGSIGRDVAIKMLKPGLAKNVADRRKFLYEAQITGDLDHPNIVPIHDLGISDDGTLFYSMKLVDGTPWLETLEDKTKPENLSIFMKVCDAVAFAHSREVIHRDLKPENVMLGRFGEVVVMDWGLAVDLKQGKRFVLGGTPAYMAPEMARHDVELIDKTSDVYLLGAMLFHVITGYPPHPGQTIVECVEAAAKNQILPADQSDELVAIALKAMADAPNQRQQSVEELQTDIRQYQSHAESIVLTTRAFEDLDQIADTKGYDEIQRCVFAFEEAVELWPENQKAVEGLEQAKVVYAQRALENEDYDLGISQVDRGNPDHRDLYNKLLKGNEDRIHRQKRLKAARTSALAFLLIAVLGTGTGLVAFMFRSNQLSASNTNLEFARDEAKNQAKEANEQRKEALKQKDIADGKTEEARREAERAEKNYEEAKRQEGIANSKTEEAEREAERAQRNFEEAKRQEELAKQEKSRADTERDKAVASELQGQLNVYKSQILLADSLIAQSKVGSAVDTVQPLMTERVDEEGRPTVARYAGWELFRLFELANHAESKRIFPATADSHLAMNDRATVVAATVGQKLFVGQPESENPETFDLPFIPDFVECIGDGQLIAIGNRGGALQLVDWQGANLVDFESPLGGGLYYFRWLPNQSFIAVGKQPGKFGSFHAIVWQLEAGRLVERKRVRLALSVVKSQDVPKPNGIISSSDDGRIVVMEKLNGELHLFDLNTTETYQDKFFTEGIPVVLSDPNTRDRLSGIVCDPQQPDSKIYLATTDGRIVTLREDDSGKLDIAETIQAHETKINYFVATNLMDGSDLRQVLISCGRDASIRIFDRNTLVPIEKLIGHLNPIARFAIVDQKDIHSIDDTGMMRKWNLDELRPSHEVRLTHAGNRIADFTAVAQDQDVGLVTAGDDHGGITSWVLDDNLNVVRQESFAGPGHNRGQPMSAMRRGNTVFTRSYDGMTLVWDLPTGQILRRIGQDGNDGNHVDMSISADGQWFANLAPHYEKEGDEKPVSEDPRYVQVWKLDSPQQPVMRAFIANRLADDYDPQVHSDITQFQYEPKKDRDITAFALSPNGRYLITGFEVSGLALWDTSTGALIWRQDTSLAIPRSLTYKDAKIRHVAWLPESNSIVAGLDVGGKVVVDVWQDVIDQAPNEPTTRLLENQTVQGEVRSIRSSVESVTAIIFKDNELHAYVSDLQGNAMEHWQAPYEDLPTNRASIQEDGAVVNVFQNENLQRWTMADGNLSAPVSMKPVELPVGLESTTMLAVDSDEDGFVYRVGAGSVWIEKLDRSQSFHTTPQPRVQSLQFASERQTAVSHYEDGRVWLWAFSKLSGDTTSTQPPFQQLSGNYRGVAVSPDGNRLALITQSSNVHILDLNTELLSDALVTADEQIQFSSICWKPDSKHILAGATDGRVASWNVESGEVTEPPFPAHQSEIVKIICDTRSNKFATLDRNGEVKLWARAESGTMVAAPFTSQASDIFFDATSERMLVGNRDGSAAVWLLAFENDQVPADPATALKRIQLVFRLDTTKSEGNVLSSLFSPSGRQVITSTESENEVVIWKTRAWNEPGH